MQRLLECIGTAQEPTVARDKNHLLQLLQSSPNAVGYASRKEISAWPHNAKFKEIRVLPQ